MEESIVERVLVLMKDYGLTASEFADKIDVQRSSMSHLVSGRNKPSLDFIQKILNNFSDINPTWLIMGTGPMKQLDLFDIKGDVAPIQPIPAENFRPQSPVASQEKAAPDEISVAEDPKKVVYAQSAPTLNIVPEQESLQETPTQAVPAPLIPGTPSPITAPIQHQPAIPPVTVPELPPVQSQKTSPDVMQTEKSVQNDKKVVKIVFFYSDNTFETFNPQ